MSKKIARGPRQGRFVNRDRNRNLIVLGLTLSLFAVGVVSARWRGGSRISGATAMAPMVPSGFEPNSPAKEYIYAGNRLIATEEPIPPPPCNPPTGLIIDEFRFRGSAGPADEFVEFYNNSDVTITVCTADQSLGWALAARTADGTSAFTVFLIPHGTVIPARGHYLAVNNSGYSLGSYPAGVVTTATADLIYATGIEDNSGIALFKTSNPANFTAANRLDAAGFSGPSGLIPDLYREGLGLVQIGSANGEYTFVRDIPLGSGGISKDTNNNAADFLFLSTDAGVYSGVASKLGSPGPQNLTSPIQRNAPLPMVLLDTTVAASVAPNRVRDTTSDPANNSTLGTLSIRRRIINNTGGPVTRLRVRVVQITTFPPPSGTADLRARTSVAVAASVNDAATCAATGTPTTPPCTVTVQGTLLEQPPNQPAGGGYNSTLSVILPQPLPAGASVNVQFLVGVQQTGSFKFFLNVEALP